MPDTLDKLDQLLSPDEVLASYGSESIFGGEAVAKMSLTPSGVLQPAVLHWRIVPAPGRDRCSARSIGVDRIMWGSDYPHIEGSHTRTTREHLRLTFAQT